jgi:type II secretory pathway component GspD/PulD (secretin)/tetratricopeptide (TPR) repeat protein
MGMAVGVALAGVRLVPAAPIMTRMVSGLKSQAPIGSTNAWAALSGGRDSYLRADYETAALFFQQAEAGKNHLTPARQEELARWIQRNNEALQARREGTAQLRKAEMALQSGQLEAAEAICKTLSTNQFLAAADSAKARTLSDQVRRSLVAMRQARDTDQNSPAMVARAKLHQARALMTRGDYEQAASLAFEATQLTADFNPGEDTPRRVLDDVARSRKDAKGLLQLARLALSRGEFDLAERLGWEAQHAAGLFTFRFSADSPNKLLKDVEVERKRVAVMNPQTAPPAPGAKDVKDKDVVETKSLKTPPPGADKPAGKDGHMIEARAANPSALPATLPPAGSTPSGAAKNTSGDDKPSTSPPQGEADARVNVEALRQQCGQALRDCGSVLGEISGSVFEDPRQLLAQGRRLVEAERFEQAEIVAHYVKAVRPDGYGLFDDTPDRVLHEARKGHARQVLAEARRLFERGKLSEARTLARRAEEVHGPYSVWDLESRPRALLGEIDALELKQQQSSAAAGIIARGAAPDGDGTSSWRSGAGMSTYGPMATKGLAAPSDGGAAAKQRALQLLADCRVLENQGRLVEARQKALEAQRSCNQFGPSEDRPELALLQLSAMAARQIEAYIQDATRCVSNARNDAALYERGDRDLIQARQLAVAFGLDSQPVDAMMGWVRQARARAGLLASSAYGVVPMPGTATASSMPASSPYGVGSMAGATTASSMPASSPYGVAPMTSVATAPSMPASSVVSMPPACAPPTEAAKTMASASMAAPFHNMPLPVTPTTKIVPPSERTTNIVPPSERTTTNIVPPSERATPVLVQATASNGPSLNPNPIKPAQYEEPQRTQVSAQSTIVQAAPQPRTMQAPPQPTIVQRPPEPKIVQAALPKIMQAPPAAPVISPEEIAYTSGMRLLEDARLELKRGETETARRLAEHAFAKKEPRVQEQAAALLRSVAAEEFNQRSLVARRSFEAGMSLYRRNDYAQAAAVFRTIDASLLRPEQAVRLRELMVQPELQPHRVMQASAQVPALAPVPSGKATASDAPTPAAALEQTYAQQVQAMQDIEFQSMRDKGLRAQREATARAQAGQLDEALDELERYLADLKETKLESDRLAMLRRPIESRYQQFKTLKAQQDLEHLRTSDMQKFTDNRLRQVKAEEMKEKQVTDLMRQSNALYKEGKYAEAQVAAQKAHELDPDNVQAGAAVKISEMARNRAEAKDLKKEREEIFLRELNDAEREGPAVTSGEPLKYDSKRWPIVKGRKPSEELDILHHRTEKERDIERRLLSPTSIDFKDTPLRQVLDDLSATNQINIVPDQAALDDAGINADRPVSLKVEGVQLKSALNLLLSQAHLTYVIKDEVLCVTTEAHAKGKLVQKIYQVGDIVIPIENHATPLDPINDQLRQSYERHGAMTAAMMGGSSMAYRPAMPGGTEVSATPKGGSMMDAFTQAAGSSQSSSGSGTSVTSRNPEHTLEGQLMDLITNTIHPESWSKVGGPGTIDYYPLGMALVVTQTPDIQEQVADLLQALRRLTDLEVAVEIRMVTLDEAFYERIGVNFSMNIVNKNTKYFPQLATGQFNLPLQNNSFTPSSFVTGLSPAGTFTSDLGIPIAPSSFGPSVPPFGGFPNTPGLDGGLTMGMAFLSDIQVYMLVEAAQGDRRTNIMQAPKLTMFNGQTSNLIVANQQFFVTDVAAFGFGGQIVFEPLNSTINTGLTLTIQTVVSADRRFVRMNLAPTLTNIGTATTALFPVTAFITPILDGGTPGPPVPFTQYVQTPQFTNISVQTTVSVPDGGTVLLGGLKTLREGRNEFGPPILSEIPWINRLFKNVGYGRESESLLIMVTPRIIINEEEEVIQTGVSAESTGGPANVRVP